MTKCCHNTSGNKSCYSSDLIFEPDSGGVVVNAAVAEVEVQPLQEVLLHLLVAAELHVLVGRGLGPRRGLVVAAAARDVAAADAVGLLAAAEGVAQLLEAPRHGHPRDPRPVGVTHGEL